MTLVKSLVIGYGNSLRGDDGIGIKVAEVIEKWHLSGVSLCSLSVRSLCQHQLTPELAAELAKVKLAVFVDACQTNDSNAVNIQPLYPSNSCEFSSHFSDPSALLSLTQALFNKCPQSWWVTVPGTSFGLGDRLSPMAKQGIRQASKIVKELLTTRIRQL